MKRVKRKRRINRRKVAILGIMVLIFIIGFFIGGGIVKHKENLASKAAASAKLTSSTEEKDDNIKASSLDKKNQSKLADAKKTSSDYEAKRETEVHESDSMVNNFNPYNPDGHKVAYLTFDDGPSRDITPSVLQTLDKYDIKATFFVVGVMAEQNKDLLIKEKNDGHSIGNHTYSHNYKYLYSSPENLIADLDKNNSVMKSILGNDFSTKLIRFPGGSFGNRLLPFRNAVKAKGYYYVDWNALNGDAEAVSVSKDKLVTNLRQTSAGKQHIVILMHDAPGKHTTIEALPQIIEYLKSQGYTFRTLR